MKKLTKKVNHNKLLKDNPHPGLYIEKKRRRYVFYKRIMGKEFILRVPFRQIKSEEDYSKMIKDWDKQLEVGAGWHTDVLGYCEADRFNESFENSDYMVKQSQGNYVRNI